MTVLSETLLPAPSFLRYSRNEFRDNLRIIEIQFLILIKSSSFNHMPNILSGIIFIRRSPFSCNISYRIYSFSAIHLKLLCRRQYAFIQRWEDGKFTASRILAAISFSPPQISRIIKSICNSPVSVGSICRCGINSFNGSIFKEAPNTLEPAPYMRVIIASRYRIFPFSDR